MYNKKKLIESYERIEKNLFWNYFWEVAIEDLLDDIKKQGITTSDENKWRELTGKFRGVNATRDYIEKTIEKLSEEFQVGESPNG